MADILISDLARTSGFPSSTLRYYERVGLLQPAGRSVGGYRVYDDRAVERLAFIGRAKRLGLNLDDVRDLVALWDDGSCSPVQARLLTLLDEKTAMLDTQIDELARLRAQLGHVRRSLASTEPSERCGPGCGCDTDGFEPAPTPIKIGRRREPDASPAIVCTLEADDAPERLREWNALLDYADRRRAIPNGVALCFPRDAETLAALASLATREVACCSFFTFTLTVDAGGAVLEVTVPPDANAVVLELFGPVDA